MAVNDDLNLDMLGDQLKHATIAARTRTGDASITVSIHEGLVVIARDGHPDVGGMSHDDGAAALAALT